MKELWNSDKGKRVKYKTVDYSYKLSNQELTLWFHPSEDVEDWIQNFKCKPVKREIKGKSVYVHQGLYSAFVTVMESLYPLLAQARTLKVGGYSHGGGLAQLLLLHLNELPVTEAIIYGSPKVIAPFDLSGYFWAKRKLKNLINVRYNRDIVPTLPPFFGTMGKRVRLPRIKEVKGIKEWLKEPFDNHANYGEYFK